MIGLGELGFWILYFIVATPFVLALLLIQHSLCYLGKRLKAEWDAYRVPIAEWDGKTVWRKVRRRVSFW
jgi:hypothetical protein